MLRDGLTGLYNHATLRSLLDVELARAVRGKRPLSFAMLDVDHFKQVNDTHGHPAGDRVLRALAQHLTQRLRRTDPGRPWVCNVFTWHKLLSDPATIERVDVECRSAVLGCFEDKMMMADILIERFRPMRERAAELRAKPETIREILAAGADAARRVAKETMEEVREAMGLWQTKRGPVTA